MMRPNNDVWSACARGNTKLVKALLAKNGGRASNKVLAKTVDAESPWNGWTPLHAASVNGHLSTVKAVLEAGPRDINAAEPAQGNTALHLACLHGHVKVADLLVLCGADQEAVNTAEEPPLALACENKHVRVVKALLARDKSPDHSLVMCLGDKLGSYSEDVEAVLAVHEKKHKDFEFLQRANEMRASWG